ncbi:MAG: polyprenyl synthetase family protein [Candidatus Symbiothrix sp.]|jgi:octaprenyl-diphosphate synthase|nr:polyprenyl synthetase family protein [Candidatus Symbiothrix sp.]
MLEKITYPVKKELEAFRKLYTDALNSHITHFQFMLDFISKKKGKHIRPLILILSAKLCGEPTKKTLEYAVVLELLHTATLIHDDVVDNTRERRGQPSVMSEYDNRAAVLLGDYILSQAIVRGVETDNLTALKIMANLAQNMSDGELTQLIAASELIVDEKRYLEVIRKKTAVLLSSCSEMGALSVNADPETTKILHSIGENLGMCFQIRDDIFDYFEQGDLGKPTGNDIREGKITLPLIHALQTAPKDQSDAMQKVIQSRDSSPSTIQMLIQFAKDYHGIEYAQEKMLAIKAETISLLKRFPDSDTKTAMLLLIDYIIEREK